MMMIHCGGRAVSFAELQGVELPKETETYVPVPFTDIITNTRKIADNLLKEHSFKDAQYALAGKDQRLFAVLQYEGEHEEMGLALGIRSSYDKSMSNGFCMGAHIFVCDNMAFSGEITYMRKHTKNVWDDLESKLVSTIYNSQNKFHNLIRDREVMGGIPLSTDDAYQFLGRMFGYGVLKARQLTTAVNCWKNPPHEVFQDKNMWSLYNSCTEALKSTPPNKIIEQHIKLHEYAIA